MREKNKKFIMMIVIIFILLFCYLGLLSHNKKATVINEINVFSIDNSTVDELDWIYDGVHIELKKVSGKWTAPDFPNVIINDSTITGMLYRLCEIKAIRVIEDPADVSEYGIDDPICSISFKAEGKSYVFEIGDSLQISNGYIYLSVGDGNIYIIRQRLLDVFSVNDISLLQ